MGGVKIDSGGGGVAFGDGAVALGVGSSINYGRTPGRELSQTELAALITQCGALKGALVAIRADTALVAQLSDLEQSVLKNGGRLAIAPTRRLLAQIDAAAGANAGVAEALRSLNAQLGRPTEAADVFISYKREDRARVGPIVEALRRLQIKVWIDDALVAGESFADDITEQIDRCRAQLVCWSNAAAASDWVRGEAEIGRSRGLLISVLLEPCRITPPFNVLHTEDLSAWRGAANNVAWAKVLQALGQKLERPGLPALASALELGGGAALSAWRRTYPDDPYESGAP